MDSGVVQKHISRLGITRYTYPPGRVGPERSLGHVVGNAIDEPVVLPKACWGGQSLAVDFRPPSAGKWDREFNRDGGKKYKPATTGRNSPSPSRMASKHVISMGEMDGKQVNILASGGLSGRFSGWMGTEIATSKLMFRAGRALARLSDWEAG